jgi:hypothetical protein
MCAGCCNRDGCHLQRSRLECLQARGCGHGLSVLRAAEPKLTQGVVVSSPVGALVCAQREAAVAAARSSASVSPRQRQQSLVEMAGPPQRRVTVDLDLDDPVRRTILNTLRASGIDPRAIQANHSF